MGEISLLSTSLVAGSVSKLGFYENRSTINHEEFEFIVSIKTIVYYVEVDQGEGM